jgi:hypothetical protein
MPTLHPIVKHNVVQRSGRRLIVRVAVQMAAMAACFLPVAAYARGGPSALHGSRVPADVVQAGADSTSPVGVVRQLVAAHLASPAGFDSVSVRAKRRWLTDTLAARFARYFRKPVPADEVPDLDGDPFTDSQDYPSRFTVGVARASGQRTLVPVRFFDGLVRYTVTYVLRREHDTWRVADIRDRQGTSVLTYLK